VLVFLDAAKHREDVSLAKAMGEHWAKVITAGQGLYYNCNAVKDKYKLRGIGVVKHHDADAMKGLDIVVSYLCKGDYLIRGVLPKGFRALTKGGMPKVMGKKRGPKRKYVTATHVRQVLPFDVLTHAKRAA